MSDWTDWAQNRRIREAESSIASMQASAARERHRLTEQLRRQSGDLQQQIDQLREAFVALVEYEDVRGELGQHADAAACRRYAREVLAATVVGGQPFGLAEPADVPSYWLGPASRALSAAAAGDTDQAEELLAEALRRDERRTAFLVCLFEAIRREPRWSPELWPSLLPSFGAVTHGQRALWDAVAGGRLGDDARRRLAGALTAQVSSVEESVVVDALAQQAREPSTMLDTEVAAARLATLRRWVEGTPVPVVEPEPAPTRFGSTPEPVEPASAPEDPLADCLRSLVDEGAPHEADILRRMQDARARMGGVVATADERGWDGVAGEADTLVLADVADPTSPGRQALAREVLAPVLTATVERLRAQATVLPPTEAAVALRRGLTATVRADGPVDGTWRDAALRAGREVSPPSTWLRPAAAAAVGVGVLGLTLAFVAQGFVFVGVLGLLAAGWLLFRDRTERADREATATTTLAQSERAVDEAVRKLRSQRERSAAAALSAGEDVAAIKQQLVVSS